jgi:glycosyltransferase involved in cell wall biosynthesis
MYLKLISRFEECVRPFVPKPLFAAIVRRRTLHRNRVWPRPWATELPGNREGINVFGYHGVPFGLGQAVRSTTEILRCTRVPLTLFDFTNEDLAASRVRNHPCDIFSPYGVNLVQVNPQEMDLLIRHFGADFFMSRYNIGYWVWEQHPTPREWRHACAYVNELWVPSRYVRKAALAGGVKKNIRVMPHCVELPQLPAGDIRDELGIPRTAILLLCLFDMASTEERKNPLAALRVMRLASAGMRDVFVVVKVRKPAMNPAAMHDIKQALDGLPHRIITEMMEKTDLLRLIRSSSAYVSLHRSEGFGLFLAEAMALGKPVVATGYSGNMDFMTADNSYPVKYERVRCPRHCHPYRRGFWWAEPDEDDAVRVLRNVLLFPEQAASVGNKAAADMRLHFSAQAVSACAAEALKEIGINCAEGKG